MITQQKYLWIRNGTEILGIIDDPISLFRNSSYNDQTDKLFVIGNEVKLNVSFSPVSGTRNFIPNQSNGLKDDLGVGDYRG